MRPSHQEVALGSHTREEGTEGTALEAGWAPVLCTFTGSQEMAPTLWKKISEFPVSLSGGTGLQPLSALRGTCEEEEVGSAQWGLVLRAEPCLGDPSEGR